MNGTRVILAAHRGDKRCCPENTVPAFRAALAAGVDMIETDIHQTADGHLVLMHDRSALRTAGVDRNIDEMTLAEVRALDAGSWFGPEFAGTAVPTVREFMEWVAPTGLLVNWEMKDYPHEVGDTHAFRTADKLVDMIREFGLEKRSMLNSFSNRVLEHCLGRWGREFPLHGQGILNCKRWKDRDQVPAEELFDWCCLYKEEPDRSPLDYPHNFAYCREKGILPCLCIPDTLENYRLGLELGCRMFTSNDVLTAAELLRQLGVR